MANLIISIISIALVVILAGAMVFFGGDVYKSNKLDAEVAKYLNESSQVQSALTLYKSHGNAITADFQMQELVTDGYLKKVPEGWDKRVGVIGVEIDSGRVGESMAQNICLKANEGMGFEFDPIEDSVMASIDDPAKGIPHCDKSDLSDTVPCCVVP
ncbi:hypothetical protein [Vibrio owensii]|uniref:hypothetical protein n=1 Tax=Vibrio harveyi group TaxID=717610 RepID=UPI003CC5DCC7